MRQTDLQHLRSFMETHGLPFSFDCDLSRLVSLRVGGHSTCRVSVSSLQDLHTLLDFLHRREIQHILLGGGTNTVFASSYPGVVILNRSRKIARCGENRIRIDSGVPNPILLSFCVQESLGGLEFLAGLPGTIGGAAAVNAGAFGQHLSDVVDSALVLEPGRGPHRISRDNFRFGYRSSRFKKKPGVILSLDLHVHPSQKEEIIGSMEENMNHRKTNHPSYGFATAGCFFQNPRVNHHRISAGKLIESCGLKGFKYKSFHISNRHANFIIHHGQGSMEELSELETIIRERVLRERKIYLEREVLYISSGGELY